MSHRKHKTDNCKAGVGGKRNCGKIKLSPFDLDDENCRTNGRSAFQTADEK